MGDSLAVRPSKTTYAVPHIFSTRNRVRVELRVAGLNDIALRTRAGAIVADDDGHEDALTAYKR